jgi:hypothetical protein
MNDLWVATRTIAEPIDNYHMMIGFSDDASRQRRIAYNMVTSFESVDKGIYAELKSKLDGGYIQLEDDFLRLKFNQEYAVDNGGDIINYKIYKWDRTSVSGTFNATYGVNWETLDLSTFNLNSNEHYTIEFEGNKVEKYVLRFKTK